jgi:hypothetical protein
MTIKYFLSITLVFVFSILSYSQSKYIEKSEKLFQKKKYEKCIKSTTKYIAKGEKTSELQFYIVASNLALFHNSESKTQKYSYLKRSIKAWEKLEKYNKTNTDYSALEDSIVKDIYSFSEINYIQRNRTKHQYLHKQLAEVFRDTTEIYRILHKPKAIVKEIKIDNSIVDIRKQALENAKHVIGVKYKYGGTDSTGFDCSGFTQYVYKSIGIDLPHNANAQSEFGESITLKEAKPGDLIFFGNNRAFHAGMIFNNKNGKIELIHCVSGGVHHQNYDDENTKYWLGRVYKVKRIIED